MLLQTVRPNIVQAIRAYRVEDLMQAASAFRSPRVCSANIRKARAPTSVTSRSDEASSPRAISAPPPTPVIIRAARPAKIAAPTREGWLIVRNAAIRAPME